MGNYKHNNSENIFLKVYQVYKPVPHSGIQADVNWHALLKEESCHHTVLLVYLFHLVLLVRKRKF